jgi:NADPH:quinone reductase-like Zn-dependent oxidoreductase
MVGGTMGTIAQFAALGSLVSRLGNKQLGLLMHKANKGLDYLTELFDAGKITPIIDNQYPLSAVAEAFQYFGDGLALGKVVIMIEPDITA